jgi:hypothetical protein
MIAVLQKNVDINGNSHALVISAKEDDRLRNQIERALNSPLSASAWGKAYLDREPVDFGVWTLVLFDTDSIITIDTQTLASVVLGISRDHHNLKPL